jgi:hypothetical protein
MSLLTICNQVQTRSVEQQVDQGKQYHRNACSILKVTLTKAPVVGQSEPRYSLEDVNDRWYNALLQTLTVGKSTIWKVLQQ